MLWPRTAVVLLVASLMPLASAKEAKSKTIQRETQAAYIQRMQQQSPDLSPTTPGSLDGPTMEGSPTSARIIKRCMWAI